MANKTDIAPAFLELLGRGGHMCLEGTNSGWGDEGQQHCKYHV